MLTTLPNFNDLFRLGQNIRLHGNRFIQMDVGVETRVHIWSDILPRAQVRPAQIHDHDYDFQSYILSGQLINIHYRISTTYNRYRHESVVRLNDQMYDVYNVDREKGILVPTEKSVILKLSDEVRLYRRGTRYRMWANWLHASAYVGHAITCLKAENRHPKPLRVMVPHGVAPDNEYRRDHYHEDYLWDLVREIYSGIAHGQTDLDDFMGSMSAQSVPRS